MQADGAGQRAEIAACAADVVGWVNRWCWTFDPREPDGTLPFDLFAVQESFLLWLAERERLRQPGLVEKSRDMGASWLCCAYAVHGWLFRSGFVCGFGSRKLEYVDEIGNPKSIFEKLRMLLEGLPRWMKPAGFNPKAHSKEACLVNPANGSKLTGEGGDSIGRGDRSTLYFVDEASFIDRPHLVDKALSQTTRVRIDVSTPNGPGNPFAEKRFSGRVPVFTMHWKDDPRKNATEVVDDRVVYPWYEEQKRLHAPVVVAAEIDIDYSASLEGIVIPADWVAAAVGLDLPATGPVCAGLDVADTGSDENCFVARQGPVVRMPVSWSGLNTTQTAWRSREEAVAAAATTVFYDAGGVGAGVRGTLDSAGEELPFTPVALLAQETPTLTRWPDGQTSQEKFRDLKAELWWLVRARFERTYEHVVKGVAHPLDELISIPNDRTLIAQLSQPLSERTDKGKVAIESKKKLKARGIKSPDRADALVLAFYPKLSVEWKAHVIYFSKAPPSLAVSDRETDLNDLMYPSLYRAFPQLGGFQLLADIAGEQVYGECYPNQSTAAYAALTLHRLLTGKPHHDEASVLPNLRLAGLLPAADLPREEEAKRAGVLSQVKTWCQQQRREVVRSEPWQEGWQPAAPAEPQATAPHHKGAGQQKKGG